MKEKKRTHQKKKKERKENKNFQVPITIKGKQWQLNEHQPTILNLSDFILRGRFSEMNVKMQTLSGWAGWVLCSSVPHKFPAEVVL